MMFVTGVTGVVTGVVTGAAPAVIGLLRALRVNGRARARKTNYKKTKKIQSASLAPPVTTVTPVTRAHKDKYKQIDRRCYGQTTLPTVTRNASNINDLALFSLVNGGICE